MSIYTLSRVARWSGAPLALRSREAFALLRLLTLLSDTTADFSRLESLIVGEGVGTLPPRKVGASPVPGCLTSEDEERETWTAESLRVSLLESLGFSDRDRTKDFGGTRFKGNTMTS